MEEYTDVSVSGDQAQVKESFVRKKSISNYKAVYESMQAGLKPPWALLETFMSEVDLMVTYKKHGKEFNREISSICSKFERAFADNNLDLLVELYEALETLKIKAAFRTV